MESPALAWTPGFIPQKMLVIVCSSLQIFKIGVFLIRIIFRFDVSDFMSLTTTPTKNWPVLTQIMV